MTEKMTVTMSMQDYIRYNNYVEKYNNLLSELKKCLFELPVENRVVLNRDNFISLMKKTNPALKDRIFDI